MTIYRKIREGKIKTRRYGYWIRIHEEDNQELFNERREFLGLTSQPSEAVAH